jgi:hypothetical protein
MQEDQLVVQFQGMIAEYERAQIIERSRRGKRHRVQQGTINVLSGAPYGYRYVKKPDSATAYYEVIEAEADVVRLIFDTYTKDGLSINAIARLLNDRRIPTRRGSSRWERSTVWAMLRNPAYQGKACFGKTERAARPLADTPPWDIAEVEYVRAIIEYCRERNIRLYFFIHPHHANLLEIIDRTGLWDRFEFWKIALARLVEEYRLQPGSPPVVLWDFASYEGYTTEAIPARGDRNSELKWFWEPSHYKKALGDIMLSRMLGESEANFGAELTSFSIDRRLAGIREARRAYREANPGEVEQIAEMARKARELRKVPLILR